MLHALPPLLRGLVASMLLGLGSFILAPTLTVLALVKLLLPWRPLTVLLSRWILVIAETWIANNGHWMRLTQPMHWQVDALPPLSPEGWYLVCSNHQSWVDILVLQYVFNRRIPLLKFFIKQQLIWVPIMGLAWWGLDFPFMRRHSEAYLARHPEARGRDQETTRRACAKFALIPTSVMSFLEGTRRTPAKHAAQGSPYRHLLKPKVGGLAVALNALGDKFQAVVDVTLVYPEGVPTFWGFMCGRMRRVIVRIRTLPVPHALVGADYANDPAAREAYSAWAAALWQDKDALIDSVLAAEAGRAGPDSV